ncbi:MAG: hypothetical protein LLG13_04520 [Bacteroidales bacterium]|nr:hypothetical protein [Bacteroidales bacterium]
MTTFPFNDKDDCKLNVIVEFDEKALTISFGHKAYNSEWQLFLTMGHEYVHVAQFFELGSNAYNSSLTDYGAYLWEAKIIEKTHPGATSNGEAVALTYLHRYQSFFNRQYDTICSILNGVYFNLKFSWL